MRVAVAVLIAVLLVVSLVGLLLYVTDVGGSGAGRGYGAQADQGTIDRSVWLVVFAVPLVTAVVVAVFALLFPQIKIERAPTAAVTPQATPTDESPPVPDSKKAQTLEAVLRVLNNDEKKIVQAISDAGGSMLQKDIKAATGLSGVKTHRVLARLAARRVVKAEKYYNTNRIVLADWVLAGKEKPSA